MKNKLLKSTESRVKVPLVALWVLFITLFTTTVFYFFIHYDTEQLAKRRMQAYESLFVSRIVHHLNDYGQLLRGAAGLFYGSEAVTRQEWKHYVDSLSLKKYYPSLDEIGYIPHKAGEHYATASYDQATHRHLSERVFRPSPDSVSIQHAAMEEALQKNDVAITKKMVLVEKDHGEQQLGFLMLFPVYEKGKNLETFLDRQNALQGYVYSIFRSESFLQEVSKLFDEYLEVHVYDSAIEDTKDLIYKSVSQEDAARAYSLFQSSENMLIGNHVWNLSANLKKGAEEFFYADRTETIWAVGVIISLLFFAVTWMYWIYRQRDNDASDTHSSFHGNNLKVVGPDQTLAATQIFHELRTPLHNILSVSKLLSDNHDHNLTSPQIEQLHAIRRFSIDMLCLVDELMELSKIKSDKVSLHLESINLSELLEKLNAMFEPIARAKGLSFSVMVDKDVPAVILNDYKAIWAILKNLCDNAIKYTDSGCIHVHFYIEPERKRLALAVRDTGPGIPEADVDNIFEPFVQLNTRQKHLTGGIGLGLVIVKAHLQQIGGEIEIKTKVNEGSCFIVYFQSHELPQEGCV